MKNLLNKNLLILIILLSSVFLYKHIFYRKSLNQGESIINVGTSADYPPFALLSDNDEIIGFDIDIIKEIARRLNLEIVIKNRSFNTLISQLQIGQLDIVAAGLSETLERKENINFSDPYVVDNPLVIIAKKESNINDLLSLEGKNIVVNTGYISDLYISSIFNNKSNIIRLAKPYEALNALYQNQADAFVASKIAISSYLKDSKDKDLFLSKYKIIDIPQKHEVISLAFNKKLSQDFINKINSTLKEMIKDGTIDMLKGKWNII